VLTHIKLGAHVPLINLSIFNIANGTILTKERTEEKKMNMQSHVSLLSLFLL
jgi:hypothetical protein